LPSSVLNEKSPFELIYKRIPSLKHLSSIDHSKIPYDDEISDPSPSRYGTPSSYSGSTSDTHNKNEGGPSLGSNAAASENDRSVNSKDNDNNISE
nr:hypothetical protein [Tanacetum cinerariifolium]